MDRGAWRATVHGGHKESDTTERLHMHTHATHTEQYTEHLEYLLKYIRAQ